MCFSATASFAAAGVLAIVGAAAIRWAPSRAYVPFAAIPLGFAMQQVSEGILWTVLRSAPFERADSPIGKLYLFFALFLWPSYVPGALLAIEPKGRRRVALGVVAILGVLIGIHLIGSATLRPSYACVAFGNIYYSVWLDSTYKVVVPFLYIGVIATSLVLSSVRGSSWLAVAVVGSFIVTGTVYRAGFISIWCFVAALLSVAVALAVRRAGRSSDR